LPLQVETQRFNATYARKDERTPLVDFLLLAASKAKAIYSQAYAELTRQVRAHSAGVGAGAESEHGLIARGAGQPTLPARGAHSAWERWQLSFPILFMRPGLGCTRCSLQFRSLAADAHNGTAFLPAGHAKLRGARAPDG